MSRNPPQRRSARARNGVAPKRPGSITAGLVRAAHPFTDAASVMLNLRQCDGSPTGRRRFTGSVYDSAGSRQGSRPQADTTAISASTPPVWTTIASGNGNAGIIARTEISPSSCSTPILIPLHHRSIRHWRRCAAPQARRTSLAGKACQGFARGLTGG